MGVKKKIKEKIYLHYFKKGMVMALKEAKEKNKKTEEANISETVSNINKAIGWIKEEVCQFSKAINIVEQRYGKHEKAAEVSTVFPFLDLSMLDIFILHKQYLSTRDDIEKNFICRTAAHHMYEFLEDCSKALGKQIGDYTVLLDEEEISVLAGSS